MKIPDLEQLIEENGMVVMIVQGVADNNEIEEVERVYNELYSGNYNDELIHCSYNDKWEMYLACESVEQFMYYLEQVTQLDYKLITIEYIDDIGDFSSYIIKKRGRK